MKIAVVGPGLMGAQIGVEYALGGHAVTFVARNVEKARQRVEAAFVLVDELALKPRAEIGPGRERVTIVEVSADLDTGTELVVESIAESLEDKIAVLGYLAKRLPNAILASNTSSLSITELGEATGASERMVGTHYWNPPLLMPLVEVITTDRVLPNIVPLIIETLTNLGKRPVLAERDVRGFICNRMQLALLREAVWLA